MPRFQHALLALALAMSMLALQPPPVSAGGGPDDVVLIVDPSSAEGLAVANHYQRARGIPANRVLYMTGAAQDYEAWSAFQLRAFRGMLAQRGISDQVDYVILAPGGPFYVAAPDLIDGLGCPAPVRRLARSAAWTLAFQRDEILAGERRITEANRYHSPTDDAVAFGSDVAWYRGRPSDSSLARRYYIGTQLGYTGSRGNTVEEIRAMIDRSVASDGSRPDGTFYFVQTDNRVRSNPRDPYFEGLVAAIQQLGFGAEHLGDGQQAIRLPAGRHDVLGVVTGHANPPIAGADMTLLPGVFADHLTSFAATFDTGGQTKLSEWIAKGASGSAGTVEEPCAFGEGNPGKFPHPRLHLWYAQGASLGEALLRSIEWAPYQTLFYGDPLTRPFAHLPQVAVTGLPEGPASGVVNLVPIARTDHPTASIDRLELHVDGRLHDAAEAGSSLQLDTRRMADGHHDLSVVAIDDSAVASQGRWRGSVQVSNHGSELALQIADRNPADPVVEASVSLDGLPVKEVRLEHNGRVLAASVLAATDQPTQTLRVAGGALGSGTPSIHAVAETISGVVVRSAPVTVTVALSQPLEYSAPTRIVPYTHTLHLRPGEPTLLDLPAVRLDGGPVTTTVSAIPDGFPGTVEHRAGSTLLIPGDDAAGHHLLRYLVTAPNAEPVTGTVRLAFCDRLPHELGRVGCPPASGRAFLPWGRTGR